MPTYVIESTIECGVWSMQIPRDHPFWRADWQRRGESRTINAVNRPNRYAAYQAAKANYRYGRMISQIVRLPRESDYREYEVRQGDGNSGTYRLGTVRAIDMPMAIRKARREYLSVPRNCATDGDDMHAYICKYGNGDYCPYVAEINLVDERN